MTKKQEKTDKLNLQKIIESLSPNERTILPLLERENLEEINKEVNIGKTAILRSLEFLSNKKIINLNIKQEKIIELGINGLTYTKQGLPERRLINLLAKENNLFLEKAQQKSKLSPNEFKVAIGTLKKKALINLINKKIILNSKEKINEKTLEEKFLETLPKNIKDLKAEEKFALDKLKSRKNIIDMQEKKVITFTTTNLGDILLKQNFKIKEMIEILTPDLIKNKLWKGKKFRRYDIISPVPKISGGKRHFVNQATDYARKIWLEIGFKEMTGTSTISSFWNFDALFTAQDHPVREMQDTFFIKNKKAELPSQEIVNKVKSSHEGKIPGSKGWQYKWDEEDAKKVLLRTHTTCISVQTLKDIAKNKEFPAKYFALGKCFRNETIDATHGFEFNQTEGIVVDENANFSQLLGYLKLFFSKMGYEKIRIRPGYFPYTEPSLEIDVFHPIFKKWVELGGAGMFRPELTIPIFGKHIPVLAWGPGFDRIIMEFFNITDLRDMYKNDINKLREMKIWNK